LFEKHCAGFNKKTGGRGGDRNPIEERLKKTLQQGGPHGEKKRRNFRSS